jgi:hypothetical protein
MATSVDSLSNHYDTLRVAPTATHNEIADAFASQMRAVRVRPDMTVARLAQLSLAYETLRDPAKRRAYDDKLGLNRPAPPPPQPQLKAAPYVVGAYGPSRVKFVPTPPATAKKEPVRPNAPAEPRVAAFIAASLREPPPEPETQAAPAPEPASRPAPLPEPETMVFTPSPEGPAIDRNKATIAAGVVGLAALALAISLPKPNADTLPKPTAPTQQAVTVGLPPATPVPDYVVPPEAAPVAAAAAREAEPKPAPTPIAEAEKTPAALADKASGEQATTEAAPVDIAADQPPTVETTPAAVEPAPAASDAKMPLPNATIARTIERIGYSCGSVSSIVADAGPGVFKVTCSSGASYRASPKGGRYHFRRLGNH